MVSLMSPDENSYSFLLWPKMITATSTEQSTESSCAFLNKPPLRFRNVLQCGQSWGAIRAMARATSTYTERLRSSLMALISIFLRPMVVVSADGAQAPARMEGQAVVLSSAVVEAVQNKRKLSVVEMFQAGPVRARSRRQQGDGRAATRSICLSWVARQSSDLDDCR